MRRILPMQTSGFGGPGMWDPMPLTPPLKPPDESPVEPLIWSKPEPEAKPTPEPARPKPAAPRPSPRKAAGTRRPVKKAASRPAKKRPVKKAAKRAKKR